LVSTASASDQPPSLFVKPQATWVLLPTTTAGDPGSVTPVTSCFPAPSDQASVARYQVLGTPMPRCMSSARSGAPLAVWAPATAQLLLPAATVASRSSRARADRTAVGGWVRRSTAS